MINNAYEAFESDPKVDINIKQSGKWLMITIADKGKGIPKDILKKIGNFGFSFGKENHINNSGAGLGVYSAKQLVEKLEGEFKIRSEINKGTSVEIKIPVTKNI